MIIDIKPNLAIFIEYISPNNGDGTWSSWVFHVQNYKGFKSVAIFGCYIGISYSKK